MSAGQGVLRVPTPLEAFVPFAAVTVAVLLGAVGAKTAPLSVVAVLVGVVVAIVAAHPPAAAYLLIGVGPLVVGIDRGRVLPLLRPSEALLVVVAATLAARGALRWLGGQRLRLRFDAVDRALLCLAVAGSVLPIVAMVAREKDVTQDDLLFASTLWKYFAVYLVVRATVRSERDVSRCLSLSLAVAAIVAAIGVLQAVELFGVPELLASYYAPMGEERALVANRATSTIAQSFAFGDFMLFNLAVAAALLLQRRRGEAGRTLLFAAALVFAIATLASGQISVVLGLLAGALTFGAITRHTRHALVALVAIIVVGAVLLRPVVEERQRGLDASGLPSSWEGRRHNLERYVLPELTSDFNYLLGVRASPLVPAGTYSSESVYIESGFIWLLWVGGVPLLLAFLAFLAVAVTATARVARRRRGVVGCAAIAAFVGLVVVGLLTTFDAHLTLRGSGELLFALLALSLTPTGGRAAAGEERLVVDDAEREHAATEHNTARRSLEKCPA